MTLLRNNNPTVWNMRPTPQSPNAHFAAINHIAQLYRGQEEFRSHLCVGVPGSSDSDGRIQDRSFKRTLDICLTLLFGMLLSPLILLIALLIWAEAGGPVLYVSERIGKNGRPFSMYKFRTMQVNAESMRHALNLRNARDAVFFKVPNDPRVTRVGRILRKYSLDEIPQLVNVLRGDMSLVGPRPPLAVEVKQYDSRQVLRLKVLPGLTGLWQVQARRSPSFQEYIDLDSAYVQNWSFWLDIKILWRTIGVVLAGTGE